MVDGFIYVRARHFAKLLPKSETNDFKHMVTNWVTISSTWSRLGNELGNEFVQIVTFLVFSVRAIHLGCAHFVECHKQKCVDETTERNISMISGRDGNQQHNLRQESQES